MEERYVRENNTNYFVIETTESSKENYQLKMLKENDIDSLLSAEIRYVNNNRIYFYNINSKQLLAGVFEGKSLSWTEVLELSTGILNLQKQIERYMLDMEHVIMDMEHVYINLSNRSLYFIYCPEVKMDFGKQLKNFMEFILEHLDHCNKTNVSRVYGMYQKILQNECNMELVLREALMLQDIEKESDIIEDDKYSNDNTLVEGEDEKDVSVGQPYVKDIFKNVLRYTIPFVQKENVSQEKEELSKIFVYFSTVVQTLLILIILILIVGIVYPKYKLIKFGLIPSIIVVIGLVILMNKLHEYFKIQKNKHFFVKVKEEEIEYSFEKKNDSNRNTNTIMESSPVNNNKNMNENDIRNLNEEEDENNTELLSDFIKEDKNNKSELLLKYNGGDDTKDILIDKFPFIIGSLHKYCNAVIDNRLVSRMHIKIIQDINCIKAEDLNSTNGTQINGNLMHSCEKITLCTGDVIEIAGISYTIHIY